MARLVWPPAALAGLWYGVIAVGSMVEAVRWLAVQPNGLWFLPLLPVPAAVLGTALAYYFRRRPVGGLIYLAASVPPPLAGLSMIYSHELNGREGAAWSQAYGLFFLSVSQLVVVPILFGVALAVSWACDRPPVRRPPRDDTPGRFNPTARPTRPVTP